MAHVEAGLRSFDPRMPEEINRRLADHVSQLLFCPTPRAVANLRAEGIRRGVHRIGDVSMDAVRAHLPRAHARAAARPGCEPRGYYLATLHRQENVDDDGRLAALVGALAGPVPPGDLRRASADAAAPGRAGPPVAGRAPRSRPRSPTSPCCGW